jgi:hypothetical protein
MVRLHSPSDLVPDYVMVSTRHELDWRGVISAQEFEGRLQSPAA